MSNEVASYYDAFAPGYERRRHVGYHRFLDDMEAALVLRYCDRTSRVLEVGCGTGLLMQRIAPHVAQIEGIDLSEGMLAQARRKGLSVRRASATALPYEDTCFDVVYAFKVLAHVAEIARALAETRRVLRPGGVAVLEFYNARSLRALRKRLFAGRVAPGTRESAVFTRMDTPAEARAHVRRAGLQPVADYGIFVVTPAAALHALPVAGGLLRAVERRLSASPATRWGGFFSVVARRPAE